MQLSAILSRLMLALLYLLESHIMVSSALHNVAPHLHRTCNVI